MPHTKTKKAASSSSRIVSWLQETYPEIQVKSFKRAVLKAVPKSEDVERGASRIIPDAYAIYPEDREINIIEIVDSSPIQREKASRISDLAEALADQDWTLGVVCYDGAGNLTSHVAGVYYSNLYRQFDGDANNATPAALTAARAGLISSSDEDLMAAIMKLPSTNEKSPTP